jgi:hypothetical protein
MRRVPSLLPCRPAPPPTVRVHAPLEAIKIADRDGTRPETVTDATPAQNKENSEGIAECNPSTRVIAASPEKNHSLLPPRSALLTPQRRRDGEGVDLKLTSSGLRGGAASGLLSLARGDV